MIVDFIDLKSHLKELFQYSIKIIKNLKNTEFLHYNITISTPIIFSSIIFFRYFKFGLIANLIQSPYYLCIHANNRKGVQYAATDYAVKHPGCLGFLQNIKAVSKDFTEYFRALHSDAAEKLLKSFPIIFVGKPSKSSQEFMEIYKKVEMCYQPLWSIDILLMLLVCSS